MAARIEFSRIRPAKPEVIEEDHSMGAGEGWPHESPHVLIASKPVGEQHRGRSRVAVLDDVMPRSDELIPRALLGSSGLIHWGILGIRGLKDGLGNNIWSVSNSVSPHKRPMTFEVLRSDAETVTLALRGELDLSCVDELEHQLHAAFSQHDQRPVVIDFRELTFIDSSGLAALVRARNRASGLRRELRLRGVGGQVRRLLDITSLSSDFTIVAD